jgi:hypothetical protein
VSSSNLCESNLADLVGDLPQHALVGALDHDSQQRFGARVPHEHAPFVGELPLDGCDRNLGLAQLRETCG